MTAIPPITVASPATVGTLPTAGPEKAAAGFGEAVAGALEGLQQLQNRADGLAIKAATGDLADVQDYTIAATQASVAMELTVAVRNRAVEAFSEIMRMQI